MHLHYKERELIGPDLGVNGKEEQVPCPHDYGRDCEVDLSNQGHSWSLPLPTQLTMGPGQPLPVQGTTASFRRALEPRLTILLPAFLDAGAASDHAGLFQSSGLASLFDCSASCYRFKKKKGPPVISEWDLSPAACCSRYLLFPFLCSQLPNRKVDTTVEGETSRKEKGTG